MTHIIDIQNTLSQTEPAVENQLALWANSALENIDTAVELTIRIVGEAEGEQLNRQWSEKSGATNVLSFPVESPVDIQPRLLGDIVLCAPVIDREAKEQGKTLSAHWAHMVIHGILHLLGYDHIETRQAESMEALEIQILRKLNINNPYT